MKTILRTLTLCLALIATTTSCIAQTKLFDEAKAYSGVTSVYISPLMCKMGMMSAKEELGPAGEGIKKLNSVDIVNCEGVDAPKVADVCRKVIQDINAEVLVSTQDNQESAIISIIPDEHSGEAKALVIEALEPAEYSVIYITGEFDLEAVAASFSKDNGDTEPENK